MTVVPADSNFSMLRIPPRALRDESCTNLTVVIATWVNRIIAQEYLIIEEYVDSPCLFCTVQSLLVRFFGFETLNVSHMMSRIPRRIRHGSPSHRDQMLGPQRSQSVFVCRDGQAILECSCWHHRKLEFRHRLRICPHGQPTRIFCLPPLNGKVSTTGAVEWAIHQGNKLDPFKAWTGESSSHRDSRGVTAVFLLVRETIAGPEIDARSLKVEVTFLKEHCEFHWRKNYPHSSWFPGSHCSIKRWALAS